MNSAESRHTAEGRRENNLNRYARKHITREEYLSRRYEFHKRGIDLPHAKLTDEQVREIRENRRGLTDKQQAEKYGVHRNTIFNIRHRIKWSHVA